MSDARPWKTCATEVKAWLEENWNPDLTVAEWWDILARSGYAAPTFPEDAWGKGWTRVTSRWSVNEAITEHGAIGPPAGLGYLLAAPTIVAHGNERAEARRPAAHPQRAGRVVPAVLRAGRGLRPREPRHQGVKDGDEWIITGQKVWTSTAQLTQPRHAARAHRSRTAEAQGHHATSSST